MVKLNLNLKRFDVCLVNLDPTIGSEIKKTRPAVIVSPDAMNVSRLKTVIVAPMTSKVRANFPTRIHTFFNNKTGQVALEQMRAIDRTRIVKKLGHVDEDTQQSILKTLSVLFQK